MKFWPAFLILSLAGLLSSCTTPVPPPSADIAHPRMTRAEVLDAAKRCIAEHGYSVAADVTADVSVRADDDGLLWTVLVPDHTPLAESFWLIVEDRTGVAGFFQPTVARDVSAIRGPDWLNRLSRQLESAHYPLTCEALIRQAGFTGAIALGGGCGYDGIHWLDYQVSEPGDPMPGRFEVRCYLETSTVGRPIQRVTRAELAYVSPSLHRFVLTRDTVTP